MKTQKARLEPLAPLQTNRMGTTYSSTIAAYTAAREYIRAQFVAVSYWDFHVFLCLPPSPGASNPSREDTFPRFPLIEFGVAALSFAGDTEGYCVGGRDTVTGSRGIKWRSGEPVSRRAY